MQNQPIGQAAGLSRGGVSLAIAPPTAQESSYLESAREAARTLNLDYAGGVSPRHAWELFSSGGAVLVDVRTAEERKFVGHVPSSVHVPWMTGISMTKNPRFVKELESKVAKDAIVLFLCRSGKRSAAAAEAATKAGFANAFNVTEGFEGEIDEYGQRGRKGGWRYHNLPWMQD
jgi:rhodanese-related sulfurtransferase